MRTNFQNIAFSTSAAFGSPLVGRTYQAEDLDGYRYGMNGQERDDEVSGPGNTNTAQFWEYDTRLGRRWNLDPRPQIKMSDYSCFGNNPIMNVDILGDSKQSKHLDADGKLIAEYKDDGDKNVYKHQTARTQEDVDKWREKFNNTSGNGVNITKSIWGGYFGVGSKMGTLYGNGDNGQLLKSYKPTDSPQNTSPDP